MSIQSQKTQGFCVADFATLSDERRSSSKGALVFNTHKRTSHSKIWRAHAYVRKSLGFCKLNSSSDWPWVTQNFTGYKAEMKVELRPPPPPPPPPPSPLPLIHLKKFEKSCLCRSDRQLTTFKVQDTSWSTLSLQGRYRYKRRLAHFGTFTVIFCGP